MADMNYGKPLAKYALLGPIQHLTQHCTATPEGLSLTAQQVSDMDIARFGQVSYHYVVLLDGTIVETLPPKYKGAHVGGHNTGNVGISYVGGLDRVTKQPKDSRTPAQKKAMAKFYADFMKKNPNAGILGHRDWSPDLNHDGQITANEWVKACPCFDVRSWINAGMPVA